MKSRPSGQVQGQTPGSRSRPSTSLWPHLQDGGPMSASPQQSPCAHESNPGATPGIKTTAMRRPCFTPSWAWTLPVATGPWCWECMPVASEIPWADPSEAGLCTPACCPETALGSAVAPTSMRALPLEACGHTVRAAAAAQLNLAFVFLTIATLIGGREASPWKGKIGIGEVPVGGWMDRHTAA